MATSRVTRLGASVLLSLVLMAGLAPAAMGASPADPIPSPTIAPAVAAPSAPQADLSIQTDAAGGVIPNGTTYYYIKGTVTGPGGTPLGGIKVTATLHLTDDYTFHATTAPNGTYSVYVPGIETYTVFFSDPTHTYLSGYYRDDGISVDHARLTPVYVGLADTSGISVQMLLPWILTLGASETNVTVGTSVTLMASVNQDVNDTPYDIVIMASDGSLVADCPTGLTCTHTVTSSLIASKTYHAILGAPDGSFPVKTSNSVTVKWAGPATHLKVAVALNPWPAGSKHSVTVTALDNHGNVAGGYRGTIHFTTSDSAAGVPANYTFTASDAGVHTFPNTLSPGLTLKTAGTQTVTATDTSHSSIAGSQSVTVTPGAATHFTVSVGMNPWPAGSTHSVTVTALDAYGNVATGYRGTIHFTTSDPAATVPDDYKFTTSDAGVHTFPNILITGLTLSTVGTQWVRATDTGTATITGVKTGIVVQ